MKVTLKFFINGKFVKDEFADLRKLKEVLLEYDLGEGEEEELLDAINGTKWHAVACDLDEKLRLAVKHAGKEHLDEARDMLRERLDYWDLSLWG